jgi:hypothetical protein
MGGFKHGADCVDKWSVDFDVSESKEDEEVLFVSSDEILFLSSGLKEKSTKVLIVSSILAHILW